MEPRSFKRFTLLAVTALTLLLAARNIDTILARGGGEPLGDPTAERLSAQTEVAAKPLTSRVIVVDAGHGGYDGGCVGISGAVEKDLNLDIALRLRDVLEESGATVVMTRETDVSLYPDGTAKGRLKKEDMRVRGEIVEQNRAELVLSIHMNQYSQSKYYGAQVFYQKGDTAGQHIAGVIQAALREGLDPANTRQPQAGDFFMCRTYAPGVLIECGFLSNRNEEALLKTEEYRQMVADAICAGVEELFEHGTLSVAEHEVSGE